MINSKIFCKAGPKSFQARSKLVQRTRLLKRLIRSNVRVNMEVKAAHPAVRGVRIVVNSTLGASSLREGFTAISTFSHTDCVCY